MSRSRSRRRRTQFSASPTPIATATKPHSISPASRGDPSHPIFSTSRRPPAARWYNSRGWGVGSRVWAKRPGQRPQSRRLILTLLPHPTPYSPPPRRHHGSGLFIRHRLENRDAGSDERDSAGAEGTGAAFRFQRKQELDRTDRRRDRPRQRR